MITLKLTSGRCFSEAIVSVAVLGCVLTGAACSGEQNHGRRPEGTVAVTAPPAPVELPIPIKVGMTWDDCQPFLTKAKRVKLIRETPDRFTDIYRIGDMGFSLFFERPAEPAAGPYRLVRVARAEIPPDAETVDLGQQLKHGMPMKEALPIMQKVGGHFVIETKDRFVAVLQASDGTYRITFERPSDVIRPEVIANATPNVIAMMGRIPLNALPEFGDYRIATVKKAE
ncbi:MAG: hypothetical protein HZA23_06565 [Nitrospirae bacterium]|nr:hypothetical protein [Nitrospirota bacterium]